MVERWEGFRDRYGDSGRDLVLWFGPFAAQAAALDGLLQPHQPTSVADGVVHDPEWRWTALESIELGVPTPVITLALMSRFSSQGRSDYEHRLLAMMRARFGGHPVKPE